ncbi:polar amino acid ABC transporter, inner membrane subunit [Methanofollis liminatans DSM 4140]|jgi:polar amino acid transport system permease protein|uniref:Polar amino acid ABC transporter, inner membrane subunit n=1 Tax=Methanofollis liminatans DSM 4140 TaxID=28892 RepID=J0S7V4_9EURY|nr:amino acid ABC transporter permease [Methanofollis liminatans]EJG06634.1 polar amino acid ABC transporter, inner membrane subunit [Methanofollis liminatans DSM 4140]
MDQVAFIIQVLLPALADGLVLTLALIAVSAPFGFLLGAGLAVGRTYGSRPLSFTARAFVTFVKGCPLLLLLFILYFGLPAVGVRFSPFEAAAIGFIFCNGAYNSEYIRGALLSIKEGQMTAAFALGMTRNQGIRYILLPQALRRAIPGMTNEFIYLIKYSSLAYMITVVELTGAGKLVATKYFTFTETFMVVGAVYLVLVTFTTVAANYLEKRYAVPV